MRHLLLLILMVFLAGPACSSPDTRDDKPPTEQAIDDDALDLDAPSPEMLADSPCGNPDWTTLPSSMKEETNPKPEKEEDTAP